MIKSTWAVTEEGGHSDSLFDNGIFIKPPIKTVCTLSSPGFSLG